MSGFVKKMFKEKSMTKTSTRKGIVKVSHRPLPKRGWALQASPSQSHTLHDGEVSQKSQRRPDQEGGPSGGDKAIDRDQHAQ